MKPQDTPRFKKEQWKFIICSMIAYMFFYITRKNLSMAQPLMIDEGVITKQALGVIITVHGVLYGLSRFVNGFWADRLNGRIFMTLGLAFSALMNFLFGCTSLSVLFAVFWIANGWTQGMGFPPCAKMLTHWIHPKELATKMSIWNTSHSFGSVHVPQLWLGAGAWDLHVAGRGEVRLAVVLLRAGGSGGARGGVLLLLREGWSARVGARGAGSLRHARRG